MPAKAQQSSQFTGVSWHKGCEKWYAFISCKGQRTHVGYFEEEEDAARAVNDEAKRVGIPAPNVVPPRGGGGAGVAKKRKNAGPAVNPAGRWACGGTGDIGGSGGGSDGGRGGSGGVGGGGVGSSGGGGSGGGSHSSKYSSKFTGVSWNKMAKRWQARCKRAYLGNFATQEAAAKAYNIEAKRVGGTTLNVILPGGGGGGDGDAAKKRKTGGATAPAAGAGLGVGAGGRAKVAKQVVPGSFCSPRQLTPTSNSHLFNEMAPYDVASNIRQALVGAGGDGDGEGEGEGSGGGGGSRGGGGGGGHERRSRVCGVRRE